MEPESTQDDGWNRFANVAMLVQSLVVWALFAGVLVFILMRGGTGAEAVRVGFLVGLTIAVILAGLWLIPESAESPSRLLRLARSWVWGLVVFVTLPVVLTHPPHPPVSAIMAMPAFAWGVIIALAGLARLPRWRALDLAGWVETVALLNLGVAATWLMLDALDARPLGFTTAIVRLTVVHFCYAGFAAPILAVQALRFARQQGSRALRLAQVAAIGIVLGTPLTAVGITLQQLSGMRGPELVAVAVLAISMLALAGLNAWLGLRHMPSAWAARLLVIGALSVTVGMLAAVSYAFRLVPGLGLPEMLYTHGLLNSLGFALPSLVAWHIWGIRSRRQQAAAGQAPD
jgi:hypothetical protein